jgi:hypothetical protein
MQRHRRFLCRCFIAEASFSPNPKLTHKHIKPRHKIRISITATQRTPITAAAAPPKITDHRHHYHHQQHRTKP